MKKLTLLASSILAAVAVSAVLAASASANDGSSTVGSLICPAGSNDFPCGSSTPLNLQDWGGFTTGQPGSEDAGTYHCNNVFFEGGGGPPVGTADGTAYYTVGRNPALDPAAEQDDCDQAGSKTLTNDSIVIFRGVGYVNVGGPGGPSFPECGTTNPSRNPGCTDGTSAGYIGVGRGDEVRKATGGELDIDPDAGGKGTLP